MPPVSNPHDAIRHIESTLQDNLGAKKYKNWFGPTTKLQLSESELTVVVSSPYLVPFLKREYHQLLIDITAECVGPAAKVRYEIGSELEMTPVPDDVKDAAVPLTSVNHKTAPNTKKAEAPRSNRKLKRMNDFVVGSCNALSVQAASQICADPGAVSPVYFQSTVGNGKTHLLEGLRHKLKQLHPDLQVMLITAEQFTNYFTQALSARTLPSFRHRFRNIDVLLVDDVDFFDGKNAVEEEFLHTVKSFESADRQVVVTANRHPRLLERSSDELKSRFLSGLVCRLERPDTETRRELVRRHAERQSTAICESTINDVAKQFTSNCRELEGAVNLLSTWSRMSKKKLTPGIARKVLSQIERDCLKVIRLCEVETAVCEMFGIEQSDLKSSSRKQTVVQPRMLAMYLSRRLTETPYAEIGEYFGGRNHSTVLSAERKIRDRISSNGTIKVSAETWGVEDVIQVLEDRIRAV